MRGGLLFSYLLKFVLVGHPHCLHVVLKVIILCIQRVDHLFMWDVKSSQNLGRRKPLWAAQSSCSACTSCPRRGRAVGHHPRRSPAPPPSSSSPRRFDNLWNLSLDWSAGTWTQGWNMFCFVFIGEVSWISHPLKLGWRDTLANVLLLPDVWKHKSIKPTADGDVKASCKKEIHWGHNPVESSALKVHWGHNPAESLGMKSNLVNWWSSQFGCLIHE